MQYSKPYISPPIPYDQEHVVDVGTMGDSYFFSLVETPLPTITLGTPRKPSLRPNHNIYFKDIGDGVVGIATEGDGLDITLECSEITTETVTLDIIFTYAELPTLAFNDVVGDTQHLYTNCTTEDFTSVDVYPVTFPAGQTSFTVTIPTVDDGVLKNKYRLAKVTLGNITSASGHYLINNSLSTGYVVLQDAHTHTMDWTGEVELYIKPHAITHFEPLYDEKGSIVKFSFGKDANGDTELRSYAVDDLPAYEFKFKPVAGVVATDPNSVEDFMNSQPLYRIIMQTGRRA